MTNVDERAIVLEILLEVLEKGRYSHIILREALAKYGWLEQRKRAFITRLAEGCIERKIELDAVIDLNASVKTTKMKPVIRNILRMCTYQLLYMKQVPVSAACNEAVKLAVSKGFRSLKGFVNGVARSIARMADTWNPGDCLSIQYSIPEWLIGELSRYYDEETLRTVFDSFLTKDKTSHRLVVRLNLSKASREEVTSLLAADGIQYEWADDEKEVLYLTGYHSVEQIQAFAKGYIQVQDLSSIMVGKLAGPRDGDFCLDVCSAPGGKAIHIADLLARMGTGGQVEARDLTPHKVELIEENINRIGFTNIQTKVYDATGYDETMEAKCDLVIADLPCSGLGVLGKKPDIKYHVSLEQIHSLAALQKEILKTVAAYVKAGGTLMYSTCTIHPRENQENVQWFLEQNPTFSLLYERQFLPGIDPGDGFYIAKLRKA